jgi:peptide/nickel transport system permease protein
MSTIASAPIAADPAALAPTSESRRQRLLFLRNRKSAIGIGILVFFTVLAIIGPLLAPYDPSVMSGDAVDRLASPSPAHWLGTTDLGQDVLSQILVGARGVMIVGFAAGFLATALAVIVGVTAGFVGHLADETLSLITNVFLVIPALPLVIVVAKMMPPEVSPELTVTLVISLTTWAWGARVLRAQTLSLRHRDFVEAARANGESAPRIVFFEILPNLTAIIASTFVGTVNAAVLSEITLAFIGVASISDWNWGTVLFWAQSRQALARGAWWWFVPAGLCVAALGMSLALINFGIDEFVNPRLRSTGLKAAVLRARGILPRVGFTPVAAGSLDEIGWRAKAKAKAVDDKRRRRTSRIGRPRSSRSDGEGA